MTLVKSDRHQVLKRIGRRHLHKWFFLFFLHFYLIPEGVVKCVDQLKVKLLESNTVKKKLQIFASIDQLASQRPITQVDLAHCSWKNMAAIGVEQGEAFLVETFQMWGSAGNRPYHLQINQTLQPNEDWIPLYQFSEDRRSLHHHWGKGHHMGDWQLNKSFCCCKSFSAASGL